LPLLLTSACALRPASTPPTALPVAGEAQALTASSTGTLLDEPSPPGGLGNVVESFSRHFGRPPAAFGVSQPSYAYGNWPARGLYVILDDSFRRAREVRINFGEAVSLAEAQKRAQADLVDDATLVDSTHEAGTGDVEARYTSKKLAAIFPTVQPPGAFVVVYDGTGDQITGIILRMGSD
jgi:hypothetical protein